MSIPIFNPKPLICGWTISGNMTTGIAGDASKIPPLLLRLYEQAQDQNNVSILTNCLDAWDILFERRVGTTRDLTSAIQQ
jgi:hypothetical protein